MILCRSSVGTFCSNEGLQTLVFANISVSDTHMVYLSFYPIFPPPLDAADEVNLDVSHSHSLRLSGATGATTEPTAPSVLILPSKLKQFYKVKLYHVAL